MDRDQQSRAIEELLSTGIVRLHIALKHSMKARFWPHLSDIELCLPAWAIVVQDSSVILIGID